MKPRKLLLDGDSPHNFLLLNATSSSLPSNKLTSTPCYFFGPYHSSTSITVLTLVSGLVLLSFVALYIWRCIVSSFSDNGDSSRSTPLHPTNPSSKGIHPSTIRSLPTISYGGDTEDMIDCVICLSELQEGETLKLIPYCGHMFHPVCVDTWLLSHVTCPLCRSTQMHDAQEGRLPVRATEDDPSLIDQESLVVENCDTTEQVAGDQVGAITQSP